MWTTLSNCGKQITDRSKVREKNGDSIKLYEVAEVEFDQYKLRLLEKNNVQADKDVFMKLSCSKLIQYGFEVEEKEAKP